MSMTPIDSFNITVIGAGVVGLSVAEELSAKYKRVLLIEKNNGFGQETSSRNSEVIHAGIYYPHGFLKASLCTEGNRLLYDLCRKRNIPHKRLGKLIIAIDKNEVKDLEKLFLRGRMNGVNDLALISKADVKKMEPGINTSGAIYSPSTGILDTHSFMKCLISSFKKAGGMPS